MKRLVIRALTLLLIGSLSVLFAGCDEIFKPIETTEGPDYTNPYIHWEETEPTEDTTPTETTAPVTEGERGYVSGKRVNLRSGPGVSYESLGMLYYGTEVVILEQRALDGVRWGLTDDGWVCMDYITLSNGSYILLGKVTTSVLNVRQGPGTNYDVVDTVTKNEEVSILEQQTVNGKAWGRILTGWVSMDYINVISSIEGDPEATEPVQTITDTSIVGTWLSIDEQDYLSGGTPSVLSWAFRKNGTYTCKTRAIAYSKDIGWHFTGEDTQVNGTYEFDGSALTPGSESFNVTIKGDIMSVFGHRTHSLMVRTDDVNLLIRELVKSAKSASSALQGSWAGVQKTDTGANGESWYFGADGSFSHTVHTYTHDPATGYTLTASVIHTGIYYFDGSRLTLCHEATTDNTALDTTIGFHCEIRTVELADGLLIFSQESLSLKKDAAISSLLQSIT